MNIAYELATYLDSAGFGVLGTDIFVDQVPEGQNGMFVTTIGGEFNNYLPVNESVVDIYVKNTSASDAVTLITNVRDYIHRMHSTTTNNAYIYSILVMSDVEAVDRDLEYAKIYKLTVRILLRNNNLIS